MAVIRTSTEGTEAVPACTGRCQYNSVGTVESGVGSVHKVGGAGSIMRGATTSAETKAMPAAITQPNKQLLDSKSACAAHL